MMISVGGYDCAWQLATARLRKLAELKAGITTEIERYDRANLSLKI